MNKATGKITRLWLTMIHVSDLDEAIKFYHEKLGLPIVLEARKFNHAELGPDEPLAKIGLHATCKKTSTRRKKRTGIVFETDDIYALYKRLSEEGVKFTLKPTEMPWGGIVADFLDPDGNELEVVQDPEHYKRKYHH